MRRFLAVGPVIGATDTLFSMVAASFRGRSRGRIRRGVIVTMNPATSCCRRKPIRPCGPSFDRLRTGPSPGGNQPDFSANQVDRSLAAHPVLATQPRHTPELTQVIAHQHQIARRGLSRDQQVQRADNSSFALQRSAMNSSTNTPATRASTANEWAPAAANITPPR